MPPKSLGDGKQRSSYTTVAPPTKSSLEETTYVIRMMSMSACRVLPPLSVVMSSSGDVKYKVSGGMAKMICGLRLFSTVFNIR